MNFKQRFHDSYERAITRDPDLFFTEFYRIFHAKSPTIANMFVNTNMEKQKKSLVTSLMLMVWFADKRESDNDLEQLAQRHKTLGIINEQYDIWMDALVETLQTVDSNHNEQDALAWRIILSPGITFMKHI